MRRRVPYFALHVVWDFFRPVFQRPSFHEVKHTNYPCSTYSFDMCRNLCRKKQQQRVCWPKETKQWQVEMHSRKLTGSRADRGGWGGGWGVGKNTKRRRFPPPDFRSQRQEAAPYSCHILADFSPASVLLPKTSRHNEASCNNRRGRLSQHKTYHADSQANMQHT